MNNFSRYCELVPVPDKIANTITKSFNDAIICKHSTPKVILSDIGSEFNNAVLSQLCKGYNAKKCNKVAYHPASNGLVERSNREEVKVMRQAIEPTSYTWEETIPVIQCAKNSVLNSSMGDSPRFTLYGEEMRLPYELLCSKPKPVCNVDYVQTRLARTQNIFNSVRCCLQKMNQEKMRSQHKVA